MTTGRIKGIAAALPDGRVLIAGGHAEGETLDSAEVFDPTTETFTALGQTMRTPRSSAVGAALPDGKVVIAGGYGPSDPVRSSEVFDPETGTFSLLGAQLPEDQGLAAGVALANGDVLVAGGISGGIPRRWSGMLDPQSGAFAYLPKEGGTQLTTERADAIAAPLPDGKVLIAGGSWPEARSSAEIFVPAAAVDASGTHLGTHLLGEEPGTATVTVTSLGGWDLEIDAVSLAGADAADFAILADTCTGAELDFEDTCTLSVRFTPVRPGDAAASLLFDDNEPVPTDVPLTATAVPPPSPPAKQPLGPVPLPRQAKSVRCGAKPLAHSRRVKVSCRVNLAFGAWEAKLRHRGKIVAHRRVLGGRKQITFRLPSRQPGRYRLELAPLPSGMPSADRASAITSSNVARTTGFVSAARPR
jgi:Kelch motif